MLPFSFLTQEVETICQQAIVECQLVLLNVSETKLVGLNPICQRFSSLTRSLWNKACGLESCQSWHIFHSWPGPCETKLVDLNPISHDTFSALVRSLWNKACGLESYQSLWNKACGLESHQSWHIFQPWSAPAQGLKCRGPIKKVWIGTEFNPSYGGIFVYAADFLHWWRTNSTDTHYIRLVDLLTQLLLTLKAQEHVLLADICIQCQYSSPSFETTLILEQKWSLSLLYIALKLTQSMSWVSIHSWFL